MKKFLAGFKNANEDNFNVPLITGELDKPLIDYVIESIRSLEVIDNIKMLDTTYSEDPEVVNEVAHITTRQTSKSKKAKDEKEEKREEKRYVPMKDSNYGRLSVRFLLSAPNGEETITKHFLIPYLDENGYLYMRGKRYHMEYQLVDASTYVNKNTLILKSLMGIRIAREIKHHVDTLGIDHGGKIYTHQVAKKKNIDVIIFLFAKMGMSETFKFLGVQDVISLMPDDKDIEHYIYFRVNKRIYLAVDREAGNFEYVMSIAFMTYNLLTNRFVIEEADDRGFWLEKIGFNRGGKTDYNLLEKGLNSLNHFERNFNKQTKDVLKLDDKNMMSAYHIVRWMIQNFSELRAKDEMSLSNKRIRRNEYIASFLSKEINTRLKRVMYLGKNLKLENLHELFNFPATILISALHKSSIMPFDMNVNDLDFNYRLSFTTKGPESLGAKTQKGIGLKYRNNHPSYLGNIDLAVVSGDPGSGGMLTPFAKMEGMYFSSEPEPQGGIDDLNEYLDSKGLGKQSDELPEVVIPIKEE